jgi:hypothetical protein
MMTVRRRSSLRVLVGLVVAVGVRATVAAPIQVTDEVRALTRCAEHMHRPVSVPESRRCCGISSDADAPATLAAAPTPPPATAFVIATLPVSMTVRGPTRYLPTARPRGERDGPPLYLGLGTFRC